MIDASVARLFALDKNEGTSKLPLLAELEQPDRRDLPSETFSDTRPGTRRSVGTGQAPDDHRTAHIAEHDRSFARDIALDLGHLPRIQPADGVPTVGELMTRMPHTIDGGLTMTEAHVRMRSNKIRHLPVTKDGALVGIVTMSDLHLLETLEDVDPDSVLVEEAMSERPVIVEPDTPLDHVARMMVTEKIGSVLVAEEGALLGIFTTIDALRALMQVWDP